MVEIRPAGVDDIEAVLALWSRAATVASTTDDPDGIATLLGHDPAALLLANDGGDGGDVVGSVIVGWDGWRATMYRLAVDPAWRRRGIATALVAAAEQCLRALGARRLRLIVEEDERPAHAFWSAMGYRSTGQTRFVKSLDP